jgi:hypothetical protein
MAIVTEEKIEIAPYYSPQRLARNRYLPALAPTVDAALLVAVFILWEYPPSVMASAGVFWSQMYSYGLVASFCFATLGQIVLMIWMSKTKLGQIARPMEESVERFICTADAYRLMVSVAICAVWLVVKLTPNANGEVFLSVLFAVYGAMALYSYCLVYRYA